MKLVVFKLCSLKPAEKQPGPPARLPPFSLLRIFAKRLQCRLLEEQWRVRGRGSPQHRGWRPSQRDSRIRGPTWHEFGSLGRSRTWGALKTSAYAEQAPVSLFYQLGCVRPCSTVETTR